MTRFATALRAAILTAPLIYGGAAAQSASEKADKIWTIGWPEPPTVAELIADGFDLDGVSAASDATTLVLRQDLAVFLCRLTPETEAPEAQTSCASIADAAYLTDRRERFIDSVVSAAALALGPGPGCVMDPALFLLRLREAETAERHAPGTLTEKMALFLNSRDFLVFDLDRAGLARSSAERCAEQDLSQDLLFIESARLNEFGASIMEMLKAGEPGCVRSAEALHKALLFDGASQWVRRSMEATAELMLAQGVLEVDRSAGTVRLLTGCR